MIKWKTLHIESLGLLGSVQISQSFIPTVRARSIMKAHSSLLEDEEWRSSTSALNQVLTTSEPSDTSICWLAVGLRSLSPSPSFSLFALGTGCLRIRFTLIIHNFHGTKNKALSHAWESLLNWVLVCSFLVLFLSFFPLA